MTLNRRSLLMSAAVVATTQSMPAFAANLAVDEGSFVSINGVEQWIGLRGYDASNPVMLFLHGGPGMGITHGAPVFDAWERDFTIAYWDMPWGGATHARNLAREQGPITVDRYVNDAITVAEHLRKTRGVRKIVLFGISFGTRVGVEMIRRRPDMFSAYVGTAQVTSGPRGQRYGYDMGLKLARERGDAAGVAALERVGPPPYQTVDAFFTRQAYTNPPGQPPSAREKAANAALASLVAASPPQPNARSIPRNLPAYDFGLNFMKVQSAIFQESWAWDVAVLGRRFQVPVFVIHGSDDLNTPMPLAKEWVSEIHAPAKAFEVIDGASHNTMPFHAELHGFIRRHVLPVLKS